MFAVTYPTSRVDFSRLPNLAASAKIYHGYIWSPRPKIQLKRGLIKMIIL